MGKDLETKFWKTARDPYTPLVVGDNVPFGRLGALVFRPHATEKSYWADAVNSDQDPDSRKCSGLFSRTDRARKTFFQLVGRFTRKARLLLESAIGHKNTTPARNGLRQGEVIVPGATGVQAPHPTDAKTAKPQ